MHSKIPVYFTGLAGEEEADFLQRTTSTVHDFNELCTLFLPILCVSDVEALLGRLCGSVSEALLVQDISSSVSVSWLPADPRLLLSLDPDEKFALWLLESVGAGGKLTVSFAILASGCASRSLGHVPVADGTLSEQALLLRTFVSGKGC